MEMYLGLKIGEGACSEVFEWGQDKVIKLAKPNTDKRAITRELENTRIVWEHGLPSPRPFDYDEVLGRPGAIFERINGESLQSRIIKHLMLGTTPDEWGKNENNFMRLTAQALHKVHQCSNLNLPSQRSKIIYSIKNTPYLQEAEKTAALDLLERLPAKHQLCHGDPNPGNILIHDGSPILIDWNDASIGNPEADLAEFINVFRHVVLQHFLPQLPNHAISYFDSIRETIIDRFVEEYAELSGITYAEVESWLVPIGIRRLSADICEEERLALLQDIRRGLE
jgi:uncharacterized protein (TIGR02172 family)